MQLTLIKLVRDAFGRDRHADVDWHPHLALVRKQDISTGERIERPYVMRRKLNGKWQYRAETIGERRSREEVGLAGARSAPDDRKPTYFSRIDTLRAIAVLTVIHIHYFAPLMPVSIMFLPNGVQLFFVISGFLITRSLLEESRHKSVRTTLLNFYIRRIFRIMPAYYVLVAIGLLLGLYGFRQSWPWIVSYTLNIYAVLGGDGGYAGHLWSLAVEEQFYLVIPFIVLLLPRVAVVVMLAGLIVGAIIYRLSSFGVTKASDSIPWRTWIICRSVYWLHWRFGSLERCESRDRCGGR
jgi:peptidoglycan/LPS O-acetylase OafA/YrhL